MVVLAPLRAVIFATTGLTMTASVSQLLQNLPHTTLQTLQDPYLESDFEALLASRRSLSYSMNELNRSLGLGDAYPFHVSRAMTGKLHFVHMAIQNSRGRPT
jgi:hypothetical protein